MHYCYYIHALQKHTHTHSCRPPIFLVLVGSAKLSRAEEFLCAFPKQQNKTFVWVDSHCTTSIALSGKKCPKFRELLLSHKPKGAFKCSYNVIQDNSLPKHDTTSCFDNRTNNAKIPLSLTTHNYLLFRIHGQISGSRGQNVKEKEYNCEQNVCYLWLFTDALCFRPSEGKQHQHLV